jgi:hypothetical protein
VPAHHHRFGRTGVDDLEAPSLERLHDTGAAAGEDLGTRRQVGRQEVGGGQGAGEHLTGVGLHAEAGQLLDVPRHRQAGVVGHEADRQPGGPEPGHRLGRAGQGLVAEPQHTVKIQDDCRH